MRRLLITAFVAGLLVGSGSLAWKLFAPSRSLAQDTSVTHLLTGTLEINDGGRPGILGLHGNAGEICIAGEALPLLGPGYEVVVRNEMDTIVGVGALDFGVTLGSNACAWPFSVPDLPEAAFYQIHIEGVASAVRSNARLVESNWTTTVTGRP